MVGAGEIAGVDCRVRFRHAQFFAVGDDRVCERLEGDRQVRHTNYAAVLFDVLDAVEVQADVSVS